MILEPFEDFIMKVLVFAAIVSLIGGVYEHGWSGCIEGVAIIFVIILIVIVTTCNEYAKVQQFKELMAKGN